MKLGILGRDERGEQHHDVRQHEPARRAAGQEQRDGGEEEPEGVALLLAGEAGNQEREDLVQPERAGDDDTDGQRDLDLQIERRGDVRSS